MTNVRQILLCYFLLLLGEGHEATTKHDSIAVPWEQGTVTISGDRNLQSTFEAKYIVEAFLPKDFCYVEGYSVQISCAGQDATIEYLPDESLGGASCTAIAPAALECVDDSLVQSVSLGWTHMVARCVGPTEESVQEIEVMLPENSTGTCNTSAFSSEYSVGRILYVYSVCDDEVPLPKVSLSSLTCPPISDANIPDGCSLTDLCPIADSAECFDQAFPLREMTLTGIAAECAAKEVKIPSSTPLEGGGKYRATYEASGTYYANVCPIEESVISISCGEGGKVGLLDNVTNCVLESFPTERLVCALPSTNEITVTSLAYCEGTTLEALSMKVASELTTACETFNGAIVHTMNVNQVCTDRASPSEPYAGHLSTSCFPVASVDLASLARSGSTEDFRLCQTTQTGCLTSCGPLSIKPLTAFIAPENIALDCLELIEEASEAPTTAPVATVAPVAPLAPTPASPPEPPTASPTAMPAPTSTSSRTSHTIIKHTAWLTFLASATFMCF